MGWKKYDVSIEESQELQQFLAFLDYRDPSAWIKIKYSYLTNPRIMETFRLSP